MAKKKYPGTGGWFLEAYSVMTIFCDKATNLIAKRMNSIAKVTNSVSKTTNSIAKTCNTGWEPEVLSGYTISCHQPFNY